MNAEVGRCLWATLHAFSEAYPAEPVDGDRRDASTFFAAFLQAVKAVSRDCDCAVDLQLMLVLAPPKLGSRVDLMAYCTSLHDAVNYKLGRPLHDQRSVAAEVFKVMLRKLEQGKGRCVKCG